MAFGPNVAGEDKATGITYKGREISLSKYRGPMGFIGKYRKGYYPEYIRVHAAAIYATTGSVKQVAELGKVPESAVRKWLNEDWFKAILDEIRQENAAKLDAKFNKIIEDAVDQVADRVAGGNYQLDQKTGEVVRIPVPLRDLTQVTATLIDKQQVIRGKDVASENLTAIQRLENLASQFEKMVGKTKPKEIIDVDFKEIKHGDEQVQQRPDAQNSIQE